MDPKGGQNSRDLRAKVAVEQMALHLVALLLVVVFSSSNRPIWIDEFLQFALASHALPESMELIAITSATINHGQTGFYSLLNVLSLQAFGADVFGLRLISYVATYLLLVSSWTLIGNMGLGIGWKILGLFAIGANAQGMAGLMYFAGEARPYMLLASTVMATFAFYTAPESRKRRAGYLLLGAFGIIGGFLNHPYYIGYWAAAVVFGYLVRIFRDRKTVSVRDFVQFLAPALSSVGLIAYVVVGSLTWMQSSPSFQEDPWYWISPVDFALSVFRSHAAAWATDISSVVTGGAPLLIIFLAGVTAIIRPGKERAMILLAGGLVALGALTTLGISGLSYFREYWILPRQWVGGMALSTIGMVWLTAEITRAWSARWPRSVAVFVASFALVTANSFFTAAQTEFKGFVANEAYWSELGNQSLTVEELIEAENWVEGANLNVLHGGRVHPDFARYYDSFLED